MKLIALFIFYKSIFLITMAEAECFSISAYVMQKISLNIHRILRMTFRCSNVV